MAGEKYDYGIDFDAVDAIDIHAHIEGDDHGYCAYDDQLITATTASNSLVAAGALEGASGRFAVKVPALIEKPEDVLKIPVVASSGAAVTLGDAALQRAAALPELRQTQAGWVWAGKDYPAARVPLRSTSPDSFTVIDASTGTKRSLGAISALVVLYQVRDVHSNSLSTAM